MNARNPGSRQRRKKKLQRRLLLSMAHLIRRSKLPITQRVNTANLLSHPNPVASYEEACERIAYLRATDTDMVDVVCRTRFMHHRARTEQAIVLLHGYTNCPQQFALLGRRFYDLGYNVLIPRLPHNGLANKLTREHAHLNARTLCRFADEMIDIAQGLADDVTVVGLSASGVMAAWLAQHRSDIGLAVVMAPSFGLPQIPADLSNSAVNLSLKLPNRFIWWDPPGPDHMYPRFSTRALAEVLRLGVATRLEAEARPPAAREILVITTTPDAAVDNRITARLVARWRSYDACPVRTYEFERRWHIKHDFVDPGQTTQQIDLVYPILIDQIARQRSAPLPGRW
jgi:carboxylesterase